MMMPVLFGFIALTVLLYWRSLTANYVYDDWLVLDEVHRLGAWRSLLRHVDPRGALTFRPIAWMYFILVVKLAGLTPILFHAVSVILHAINGGLVAWIGVLAGRSRAVGGAAGALYLAFTSLHVECLYWLVGFFDIGAMTFALLCVLFIQQGRLKLSAAMMGLAMLTKEAAAFLPLLVVVWAWATRRTLREHTHHAIVLGVYLCVKVLGASPFSVARDNPHAMAMSMSGVLTRLEEYVGWMAGSFFPHIGPRASTLLGTASGVLLLLLWIVFRRKGTVKTDYSTILVLVAWMLLALTPVVLLKNQSTRYYAVHAIPPMAILVAMVVADLASLVRTRWSVFAPAVLVSLVAFSNVLTVETLHRQGLRQVLINDGYFHLIYRAAAVEAIHDSLMARRDELTEGTTVSIDGVPIDAVGGNRALRLWMNDTTLQVVHGIAAETGDSLYRWRDGTQPRRIVTLRVASATE
jgi:hypothetical protein